MHHFQCMHQGSKKLKFDMNLIRHSPFKTYFLVIKRVFTSSSSHKFSLLVLAPIHLKRLGSWLQLPNTAKNSFFFYHIITKFYFFGFTIQVIKFKFYDSSWADTFAGKLKIKVYFLITYYIPPGLFNPTFWSEIYKCKKSYLEKKIAFNPN